MSDEKEWPHKTAWRRILERSCVPMLISKGSSIVFHSEWRARSVVNFEGAKRVSNDELLEIKCDILVRAALENQITGANVDGIKAKIVAKGANGSTTPEADRALYGKGIFLIPDILANSGGVA